MKGSPISTVCACMHKSIGPYVYAKKSFCQEFLSGKRSNDEILVFTCRPDPDGD